MTNTIVPIQNRLDPHIIKKSLMTQLDNNNKMLEELKKEIKSIESENEKLESYITKIIQGE